jgi:hypothetical protein
MTPRLLLRRTACMALLNFTVLLALAACGGGGGSGGGGGGGGGGGVGGGDITGVIWHENYALDLVDGSQLASLTGKPPRLVDASPVARPVTDGSRYAIYDYDSSSVQTRLSIKRTSDGAVLFSHVYEGYLVNLKPSPVVASQLIVRYSEGIIGPKFLGVVDLASGDVLEVYPAGTAAAAWLSDGRVAVIADTGALSVGEPGAARTATGNVDLLGRTVTHFSVQPGGTRLLLGLLAITDSGNVEGSDLWLSSLDGSGTLRYTRTNISNYGFWSPDGQRIGFDVDTGSVCVGGGCIGTCEIWHAPASASTLNPLPSAPGEAARFAVTNRQGQTRTLGCEVLGWTP